MSDRVSISVDGGVADVQLNRPDKLNAIDAAMFQALADAGDALAGDPSVRVVVLSGKGRAFCAGLDVASFFGVAPSGGGAARSGGGSSAASSPPPEGGSVGFSEIGDRLPGRITNLAQQAVYAWTELAVPVIAAVHGVAFGGGAQLALGADIRFMAPDARLAVMEVRWGLLPDMTGCQMLPRLVGIDVAKELVFTGREVRGGEAHDLGLATHVTAKPRDDALMLARTIAAKNPKAIRGAKALLNAAGTRPLAESFLEETRLMAGVLGSPNQMEAVAAEMEGRAPVFADEAG